MRKARVRYHPCLTNDDRAGEIRVRKYPDPPAIGTVILRSDVATLSKSLHRGALARIEANVVAALERIGYRLLAAEIDVDAGRARVEVRRHDGYTLTLDVRNGAGTITREMQRCETVAVGRRGDRFRADRLSMEFLGRARVAGARAALRAFADMIGDNVTTASRLNVGDMRVAIERMGDAA